MGIGHGEQEQIEGAGLMAELIDIAVTDQPLIHPAELFGDFPDPRYTNGAFVHAGSLLVQVVNHMCLLKPLPVNRGGWFSCEQRAVASSLGADPGPTVDGASEGLCQNG
jgi:hypothetical protein